MKPPKCKFCGVLEWRHVCGVNKDVNNGVNKTKAAAGGLRGSSVLGATPEVSELRLGNEIRSTPVQLRTVAASSRNRNAYFRFYMQARRAIQRGLACPWPQ